MRTIKFRMWNNVKSNPSASRMFYDTKEVMECLKQQMLFDQGNKRLGYNHVGDGSSFMQFTGLTDKNGREIWEGDNVRINGNEYFIRFNIGVFVAESVTANHLSLISWEFNGTDVTVTGNIHEQ
jgi:uncharacterized phage protein (TIGR01671 family)